MCKMICLQHKTNCLPNTRHVTLNKLTEKGLKEMGNFFSVFVSQMVKVTSASQTCEIRFYRIFSRVTQYIFKQRFLPEETTCNEIAYSYLSESCCLAGKQTNIRLNNSWCGPLTEDRGHRGFKAHLIRNL